MHGGSWCQPTIITAVSGSCRDVGVCGKAPDRAARPFWHPSSIPLHGYEATKWLLYREALALGLDARIGLEDGAQLPSGERAADNAALIGAARQMA